MKVQYLWLERIQGRLQTVSIFSERPRIGRISRSCAKKLARRTRDAGFPFWFPGHELVHCVQLETACTRGPDVPAKRPHSQDIVQNP